MIRILLLIFVFLVPNITQGQIIVNLANAVVKITNEKCIGTAFVINEDENSYHLLTSGHTIHCGGGGLCCSNNTELTPIDITNLKFNLVLYHNGKEKQFNKIVSILTYKSDGRMDQKYILDDLGLLSVSKESIKDYGKPLHKLTLSTKIQDIQLGRLIWTCGSPNGGWPTIYRGTIIESTKFPDAVTYYPPASQGRSGSPVMNYNGQKVIGITTYTSADDIPGTNRRISVSSGAIPYWQIQEFLDDYYKTLEKDDDNE